MLILTKKWRVEPRWNSQGEHLTASDFLEIFQDFTIVKKRYPTLKVAARIPFFLKSAKIEHKCKNTKKCQYLGNSYRNIAKSYKFQALELLLGVL